MCEHDIGKSTRLRIGSRSGNCFELDMEMIVDFLGYTGEDRNQALLVRGRSMVPFAGVIVVPDNLSPKPNRPAEMRRAVAAYLDTTLLTDPQPWCHAFRMQPLPGV
jgi:hypothetical protein